MPTTHTAPRTTRTAPLWGGPETDGITYSLLSKYIVCKERFRLLVVEGIAEEEVFRHAIAYGVLWHSCEEATSKAKPWGPALRQCCNDLTRQFPDHESEILKWCNICKHQYPIYLDYWKDHIDEKYRKPIFEEETFAAPYILPSGRKVLLRGRFDSVCLLPSPHQPADSRSKPRLAIFLQENKTKGDIDEEGILRTVGYNLQTMFYQVALRTIAHSIPSMSSIANDYAFGGTIYNVVRRPLSDRYAIRQRVKETPNQFYARLGSLIRSKPGHYFLRWKTTITDEDIAYFCTRVFHPLLEGLLDWWAWVSSHPDPWAPGNRLHYQSPWGVYNSLGSGFRGDYFDYLTLGRENGLVHITNLFPEL